MVGKALTWHYQSGGSVGQERVCHQWQRRIPPSVGRRAVTLNPRAFSEFKAQRISPPFNPKVKAKKVDVGLGVLMSQCG